MNVIDVDALPASYEIAHSTPSSDRNQVPPVSATLPAPDSLVYVPIRPPRRKRSSKPETPKPPNEGENDGAIIVRSIDDIELDKRPGHNIDTQIDGATTDTSILLEEAAIEYLQRF